VLLFSMGLAGCWWLLSSTMQAPRNLPNLVVRLPVEGDAASRQLAALRGAPGVADLLLLEEENTAYLKIDENQFDRSLLDATYN